MANGVRPINIEFQSPFIGLLRVALFLGFGWAAYIYLRDIEPLWVYWACMGLVGIGMLLALTSFFGSVLMLNDQRKRAKEMRTASGGFADAKLADAGQLQSWGMTEGPGLFLGLYDERRGVPIIHDPFAPGESHMMTFALNRGGKTSGLVIPALLSHRGASMIVTDPKRELAAVTMAHRELALGQNCIVLDPFGNDGPPSANYNVLDLITDDAQKGAERLPYYLRTFANQLLPPVPGDGDGEYFRKGGRDIIAAGIVYLLLFDPANFNLNSVAKFVHQSNEDFKIAVHALRASERLKEQAQKYSTILEQYIDPAFMRTSGSFFKNARDAMELYLDPILSQHIKTSSFSMDEILNERTTIYISLGTDRIEYAGSWMGLIVTIAMETLAKARRRKNVLFLLDEAGTIGHLPGLDWKLPQLPGQGLRCWFMFQSDEQIKKIYGESEAKIIMDNCSVWQGWGFRREEIVDLFSFLSGKRTHKTASFSTETQDSKNFLSRGVSEIEVPVLNQTDLIHAARRDEMYIYSLGRQMIKGCLMPYWRDRHWRVAAQPNPIEGGPPANDPAIYSIYRNIYQDE